MIIAVLCHEEDEVTRREWCKDWLQKQNERGSHATILQELRTGYELDFTNYMLMDPNTFYDLLDFVRRVSGSIIYFHTSQTVSEVPMLRTRAVFGTPLGARF